MVAETSLEEIKDNLDLELLAIGSAYPRVMSGGSTVIATRGSVRIVQD